MSGVAREVAAELPASGHAAPIIELAHVTVRFGDLIAIENVNISIERGEFIALIGPNGSGKARWSRSRSGWSSRRRARCICSARRRARWAATGPGSAMWPNRRTSIRASRSRSWTWC